MYNYLEQKSYLFTEEGSRQFLRIRDRVARIIKEAGCIRMDAAISNESGSSWELLACVDRLVELGELYEVPQNDCVGQHRIFIRTND